MYIEQKERKVGWFFFFFGFVLNDLSWFRDLDSSEEFSTKLTFLKRRVLNKDYGSYSDRNVWNSSLKTVFMAIKICI